MEQIPHGSGTYIVFQRNIARARALLEIQNVLDLILLHEENIISALESASKDDGAMRDPERKLQFELESVLGSIRGIFTSAAMEQEMPLYYHTVVSTVTAFESYLKNTLIEMMIDKRRYRKKINRYFRQRVDFSRIKDYNINKYTIQRILNIRTFTFFKMKKIDLAFRQVLERDDRFTIFNSPRQSKRLRNFIELRHLIVHKGGVVDAIYRRKTSCKIRAGEQYPVMKKYIQDSIGSLVKVVNNIERERRCGVTQPLNNPVCGSSGRRAL